MAHHCKECGQNCMLIQSQMRTSMDIAQLREKQNHEYRKAVRSLQDDVRRLEEALKREREKWTK